MILAVRTEIDSVLGVIAPMGLAAAAGSPSLLIDLDPEGPEYPGARSLAELSSDGPTRSELTPKGLALLRNGGVSWEEACPILIRLGEVWPAVTLRLGAKPIPDLPFPLVPVVPLLPGVLAPSATRAAVWQRVAGGQVAPGPGPLLPPLRRSEVESLLKAVNVPRSRWVNAWKAVWRLPWR